MAKAKASTVLGVVAVLVTGAGTPQAWADAVQCRANMSSSGGFFTGKTYKTFATFPNTPMLQVFKKAEVSLLYDGYKINQADKDMGIISASQSVNFSSGSSVPLNILIESVGAGSKATVTLTLGAGERARHPADDLCKPLDSVNER